MVSRNEFPKPVFPQPGPAGSIPDFAPLFPKAANYTVNFGVPELSKYASRNNAEFGLSISMPSKRVAAHFGVYGMGFTPQSHTPKGTFGFGLKFKI